VNHSADTHSTLAKHNVSVCQNLTGQLTGFGPPESKLKDVVIWET